jgi:hypothetical protein
MRAAGTAVLNDMLRTWLCRLSQREGDVRTMAVKP